MADAYVIVLCLILDSRQNYRATTSFFLKLYCALFWIQGKTGTCRFYSLPDCTVPYFGFKAKLCFAAMLAVMNCTVPYFGFKAKQRQ